MTPTHEDIAAYLFARLPGFKGTREELVRALGWYAGLWLLQTVVDDAGRIVGSVAFRRLPAGVPGSERYRHDEAGEILWIEWAATESPEAMRALVRGMLLRFKGHPPEYITGARARRGRPGRLVPLKRFLGQQNIKL